MEHLATLPEDVELDGELPTSRPISDKLRQFKPSLAKSANNEQQQMDSGFVSISPASSLESGSLKHEEKLSVQCSDGNGGARADTCIGDLEKKIDCLSLDEDEGIDVLKSLDSLASDTPEPVEVDLFEQDLDGDTILHMAIVSGATNVASALIDIVMDKRCLNLQNDLFQSPLHMAIIAEHYDIAVQLVKKGADVKLCDKQGNTPLHLASRKGEKEVIRALLETFGNNKAAKQKYFAAKNCEGLTCLHLAAELKHYLTMGFLFARGADVNMGDAKSGRTILHYAVERKDMESVVMLLTHPEINVDCKTFKGETPLVLAYWRNYQDMVKKLKSKGAFFSYELFEDTDDDSS